VECGDEKQMPTPVFWPGFFVALIICATTLITLAQEDAAIEELPIAPADREHWAYKPLLRPELPETNDRFWPRTAIDRFILVRLEDAELSPAPEAERLALLRRVTFDLTGVPPTPEEIEGFLADDSPLAYERQVERLLTSPKSGEHFAQFWLDLARFAETNGFEHDLVRSEAWKYRDWVIDAFNRDLPYDEFLKLQIAGDELHPGDEQARIATGFCLAGPDMPDINSQEERRDALLNEIAGTIGSALMGVQTGCAQCHDHKYDPVSQADFYRLRAVFEPSLSLKRDRLITFLPEGEPPPALDSRLMIRGDFRRPGPKLQADYLRIGNPWQANLASDAKAFSRSPEQSARTGFGQRSALAAWIVRPDHPLSTRTIANRIWQWHFGAGLSRSPSDFGLLGDEPLHGELLDWLACELPSRAWSLKELHRLIVTSATYRQASRIPTHVPLKTEWKRSLVDDPENRWFSRFPRRRLTGEMARDAMLAAGERLSFARGGPGVRPPLAEELTATLLKGQWEVTVDASEHARRSIYLFARRNLRFPEFEAFDRPDANASCPQRNQSVTAAQSLWMLNSEFSLEAARRLAGFAWDRCSTSDERTEHVFQRSLGRRPSDEERESAQAFLTGQVELLQSEGRERQQLALPNCDAPIEEPYAAAALVDYCLALFATNEFLYLD
jgi:hypothetical protein